MEWILDFRHDALTPLFLGLTFLGDVLFFLVFLSLGYWLGRRETFYRLTLLLVVSGLLNATLKGIFQVPRPDAIPHLIEASGWSFPSGHAQLAATLWPAFAWELRRRWAWIAAALLVVGIAASRVYLGVHTPVDVLAGIAVGLLVVSAARLWLARPRPWWTRLGAAGQTAVVAVVAGVWLAFLPGGVESTSVVAGGALVGLVGGHTLARRRLPWTPPESLGRRLAVVAVGLAGALALRLALKAAFGALEIPWEAADFVRYAAVGLWVSFLGPAVFLRLGLGIDKRWGGDVRRGPSGIER